MTVSFADGKEESLNDLIRYARTEIADSEGENVQDVSVKVQKSDDQVEMFISASLKYGLQCPQVASRIRRRLLAKIGGNVAAIHFHIKNLIIS